MGIQFEKVTYTYPGLGSQPQAGLEGLNLSLQEGRFIAVVGAPGSGKSTLLQHFNALLCPQEGRIRVLDFELGPNDGGHRSDALRKRVGLVFQFPEQQLFEETVEKDICFGPLNFGVPEEEAAAAAQRAAATLGLEASILQRSPFRLSGGQIRKAAIAAVLAADPELFVLDEPTASLDPVSREELMAMLRAWCGGEKTVVVVTHRLEEVLPYADDYIVMNRGKAVFHGGADELLRRPELMDEAGIAVPGPVRMMMQVADRFGVGFSHLPVNAPEAAQLIAECMTLCGKQRGNSV